MAPIKFEEQLKDKLEKRSLSPSADSWAKLSKHLDTEEKKAKNPWFWWMGIAAGLILMLAIAVQTLGSKAVNNTIPELVEEDTIENEIEGLQSNINEIKTTELVIEDEQIEEKISTSQVKEKPKIIDYKSVILKKQKTKTQLVNTDKSESIKIEEPNKVSNGQKPIISQPEIKEGAVVQAINEFKSENKTVTDREVDSLLKLASKELFKDKLQKQTSKTVDANSLLQDVEEEMGQSFRSKVFEALKDSYETIKTAVAERNN
ncbi:hypothetical protein [Winogradskyella luteola]|uniref:Uncharacterized protein n=1 Tax=Winogradskyella luteola TaxID=2828330 RepID=A0A9X1F9X2_9FLAO|nr:hypothetical protein [Winogradskyella luteola]MBV7269263.1 hypothetical protein [Winogradskyella luteola]